jgi:Protein of unknown function (DUF559)
MDRKVSRARELRRDGSYAEKICWELLRAHRMAGIKFRRQHPIGPYFADFACVRLRANEVVANREGIWATIDAALSEQHAQPPLPASPPSGGEEEERETSAEERRGERGEERE